MIIKIPEQFILKTDAYADSVSSKFGRSYSHLKKDGQNLIWTSKFVSESRDIPVEDYPDYYKFMIDVRKLTSPNFSLIKKQ